MSDWRPKNWKNLFNPAAITVVDRNNKPISHYEAFEYGADALFEAVMEQRPSNEEIKLKIISCLYGGMDVSELQEWLKEKLLVKEK